MVLTRKRSGRNERGLSARDVKTYSDSSIANVLDVPNLIRSQIESFDWFKTNGLAETFRDCSPIVAGITRRFANGEASRRAERFELYFLDHWFDAPQFSPEECREREITFSQPLYVKAQLRDQETGEITESDIFFGDVPMMTETGTFIINGAERVLVSQLQRAPGVYFEREPSQDPACPECGKLENWYYKARISASRGARIELSTWTHYYARRRNLPETITVSVDRRRRMGVSTFLYALGIVSAEEMRALFEEVDNHECRRFVAGAEPAEDRDYNPRDEELRSLWDRMHPDREFDSQQAYRIGLAQRNLYKWLRPGEPAVQVDAACTFVLNHFYDGRRFDLGEVGRIKVDQRLGRSSSQILTEHQKNILDLVRNRAENSEGATPAEIFEASGREHRILSDRDVDALINYGYLARRADRLIVPVNLFEGQSDDEQTVRVETYDAANAGTLLSLIGTLEDGARTVRVQQQVTETLGDPVAVATQPIFGGSASDDAITHGEVAIMKNRFLAGESIVEAGQLIYAERVSQGPLQSWQLTPVRARASRIVGVVTEVNCGANGNMHKVRFNLPGIELDERRVLDLMDIVDTLEALITQHAANGEPRDNIDHLGNRRVRVAGELMRDQVRIGLLRMHRMFQDRVGRLEKPEDAVPAKLVNVRPVTGAIREFFGGDKLSQFMDQTNPLAELTHKRRLSALGRGGLTRERAGFDVRDVHASHYGRICPIETPEGANIGLLSSLAAYARIDRLGFIETPYWPVIKQLWLGDCRTPGLPGYFDPIGHKVAADIRTRKGEVIVAAGDTITEEHWRRLRRLSGDLAIDVAPFVDTRPDSVQYLTADLEEQYRIAQANSGFDDLYQFTDELVEVREGDNYRLASPATVEYADVSPLQIMSVSAALIPFLEHDDANRALMGCNMQRQAVPLLQPQAPIVGTGIESRVARDSGQVLLSRVQGSVVSVNGREIVVVDDAGREHSHRLVKFARTNQGTCLNQRPVVQKGDHVNVGDTLADSSSTDGGELALGQNVLVAFMSWEGYNYEDAIIISERLVKDDQFTSVHIEKYEVESRSTKLGDEEITRDIPNVGEGNLRDLDERGIIRIGADVGPGDILVGKVTPKGETEMTAEERLLRAIFGEKSKDVRDTSLRVPHGQRGKVIGVKALSREKRGDEQPGDQLPPDVNEAIRVWVAQTRKISVGDKMAGRHGNKGVVSRILPEEDMPFLPDGTPVDIILNPIGVPSRMNLGQVLESHLGWAARSLNFQALTPVFEGADDNNIEDSLARWWFAEQAKAADNSADPEGEIDLRKVYAWLREQGFDPEAIYDETQHGHAREACLYLWLRDVAGENPDGLSLPELHQMALDVHRDQLISPPTFAKFQLYDGRSGEPFDQPVAVGSIYMLKLIHLVEDKIHARSTGPYSMITQQPLGGKAQFGGQRFGEMEVWALEAYSAAHNLQEVLTIKSDDVTGRVNTYESIVKGNPITQPGIPESFNVLLKELQSLGLNVRLEDEEEQEDGSLGLPGEDDYLFTAEVN
ncbi:MAG: DNA-directed RNA polymerase subunit beta [Chloroflexota bacterium]|nr:DNA-directed RNA polymerase subunit beta [Chloroflexota bacterium]MDE2961776.1 DNA-directed RNA polymerase subunit beta [Chloroflexota bacterium]